MAISKERNNKIRRNLKCLLICIGISMANMQYGFDIASIAGFQAMVGFLKVFGYSDPKLPGGWGIATKPQQLISSSINIGTIIGFFLTPIFGKFFARRPAIWVGSVFTVIGTIVQITTEKIGIVVLGRIIIGISNSFFFTFANIYISEASPAHLRAVMGMSFGIWVNVGSILAAGINLLTEEQFDNKLAYQIPLACLFFVPLVLSILVCFIPESPRWLVNQGRHEEAETALRRLRGTSLKEEHFREEYVEIVKGIEKERENAKGRQILDIFRGTDLRRTIICVGVVLSHSSSGLWLYLAYGTYFYQMAGIKNPFHATTYSISVQFLAAAVGMYLMYKVLGRRSMMLIGTGMAAICQLITAAIYTANPGTLVTGKLVVAFTILLFFFYMAFSGFLSWPLASEIVSSRLRVTTFSFATMVNYFFAWLTAFCTPYFLNPQKLNWGPRYCYIWAASNAVTFVFFWLMLPNVKGRSLEEIDELFEKKVSIKDFPKFECETSTRAHEIAIQGKDEKESERVVVTEVA